jgi:hypothetical protein
MHTELLLLLLLLLLLFCPPDRVSAYLCTVRVGSWTITYRVFLISFHAYKILVRKPERKRPLRRPGHRWEDTIRMDLRKIGWEDVDWIYLAEDRDQWQTPVNIVMNLRVP